MKSFQVRAVLISTAALCLLVFFLFVSRQPQVSEPAISPVREAGQPPGVVLDSSAVDSFASFSKWLEDFRTNEGGRSPEMIGMGVELARLRAEDMIELIEMDPESAVARSLSQKDRRGLPREIRALIERPFSTRAEFDVFPLCSDSEGHGSAATFGERNFSSGALRQGFEIAMTTARGERFEGFVFGQRLNGLSRSSAPVQGISLKGKAALREEVFTAVPKRDLEEMRKQYATGPMGAGHDFLTAEPVGEEGVAALAGGRLHFFANPGNLVRTNDLAAKLNRNIGEENGAQLLFTKRLSISHNPIDEEGIQQESEELAAIPSDTTRSAICILVDFPDNTGVPINAATLQARMDGEVHDQVASMSYHKTGISTPVITQTFRLPQPTTYYNGTDDGQKKNGDLFNHAIAAAEAAGVNTSGYDHRCVFFKGGGMGYCGLATVGGSKIWLPCHGSKVIVHELGHNFGLGHASFWTSSNDDPVDPGGSTSEYGDNTSIMGGGGVSAGHFHVQGKRKLNWLESDQVHYVGSGSSEQSLRIHRFDHEDTDEANGKRAIRVVKGANEYFWIGYRQRYGGTYPNYQKGVQLHWQQPNKSKSWLIDLTPQDGKNNAGLPLGRTYSDPASNVHVTALKRGGTNPDQWFDVQVNVGPFAGNVSPTGTVNIPSRVPVNTAIDLGVTATDTDGDPLAYFFDVGDGSVLGNDGTLSWQRHVWDSTGNESVTVTVSDRKGGLFRQTIPVQVQAAIPAPTGISASDSAHSNKIVVSWTAPESATSYTVYRGTEDAGHASAPVATVGAVSIWEDMDVIPGQAYFYRVQALGSNSASELSVSDAGEAAEGPPDPPTIHSISDNLYLDRIQLAWSPVEFASGYEILRGTSSVLTEAHLIATVATTSFQDTQTEAGIRYFYWIRSTNGFGTSEEASGSGSRRLSAPKGLSASDGTSTDRVDVVWAPVPNATSYRIYRGIASDSTETWIGESTDPGYSDSPSSILTTYWYSVRAYAVGSGEGEAAVSDSGFRVFESPKSVATVHRAFDDRIELSWDEVHAGGVGPIEYVVLRAVAGMEFGAAVEVARTDSLNYQDFDAEPGVEYSYWIVGKLEDADVFSPPGEPIVGIRSEVPPFQPDAAIGATAATEIGNDIINRSGTGQFLFQKTKKSKPVSWFIRVQNDGIFEDDFRVIGSRGDPFFQVSLQEMFGARQNVTASSVVGSYRVNSVEPNGSRLYLFTATPTKKARKKGRKAYFDVRSVSASDVEQMDRVLMQVTVKKDKKRRKRR